MKAGLWLCATAALFCLAACGGKGGSASLPSNPAKLAGPGTFQVLAVNDYRCAAGMIGGPPTLSNAPFIGASAITSGLTTYAATSGRAQWNRLTQLNDTAASPSSFTANANLIDALFYLGHGQPGNVFLDWNCGSWWGPGNLTGGSGSNLTGMPVTGRLKWMFLISSTTVVPLPNTTWADPTSTGYDKAYEGDWTPAFRSSPNHPGSLHGIYGAWMGPGTCVRKYSNGPGIANRACDLDTSVVSALGSPLTAYLWSNSVPLIVHDAWFHALADAGFTVGGSSIEDQQNLQDTFTGSANVNPDPGGGTYVFTYITGSNDYSKSPATVNPDTFTLSPRYLTKESIDDNAQINRAQAYLAAQVSQLNDGMTTTAYTDGGLVGKHYYGQSGASVVTAAMEHNPVAFDQTTAYNAAVDYITSTLGMPSDAQLASVGQIMESTSYGTTMNKGYVFTWLHGSNGVYGGDALRVMVDDHQTQQQGPCLAWDYTTPDPPLKPVKYCSEYSYTTIDKPNISYSYRMWRVPSSATRSISSAGRSTGQSSIDALTASYSLPANTMVTGYSAGYWTTGIAGSADDGAQPAWIFNVGDNGLAAVDAFSGQYLGSITL